jgi:hypothetical protein
MAVQSDTSSISYTGNNSTTTSYAVPFVFLENAHLAATAKVTATGVETAVTLTNHTGAGDANGGTVRTAVAVPATSTLTIFRVVPATQTTTYQEGGDFPAASHERALDKLTMLAQQVDRSADRAIRVSEADGSRNDMVAVANSLVGLDGSKQPKAMTASEVKTFLALSGVTLDVDAGMKTFADASERALAVPDFTGQLGTQRDTADIYISTGTSAGNWSLVDENMSLTDFASGFFTADGTGRGKFGSGFVDTTLLADEAVTTAKIDDEAVTTAKIDDEAVTPAKLSQPLTLAASVATTSGTSIDFTGIPSWVKRITVMLNGVSTNGTANLRIQLGDSGGIETSNYTCVGSYIDVSATADAATKSSGFDAEGDAGASGLRTGLLTLGNLSGNIWCISGNFVTASTTFFITGSKTLSDKLTQIRITTSNGTDTFDAGEVNIVYEG